MSDEIVVRTVVENWVKAVSEGDRKGTGAVICSIRI